ncbi:SAM-dependent methyltransferase [Mycobacteroides abscessus]|uniref:SAM-dependent methyltransferase n=1 Tax=Mycobacteroides abscessus TaxID=36809 RepID=UPI002103A19D|nr:SAM-dependent methyltransferase [Mycobacteroides abscessus]
MSTDPQLNAWMRSDHDAWDIVSSVGHTALFVAGLRALHTGSPAAVASDPYAEHFVAASRDRHLAALLSRTELSPEAASLPRLYGVQTRFFDRFLLDAARGGLRQIVILAAGLDTRAYRLSWPPETTVFEADQPEVLEFKSAVLAEHHARPTTRHRTIAVDLRDNWPHALVMAGFDPAAPTAWLVEGLRPYLRGAAQSLLFKRIGLLSAPKSRLAVGELGSQIDAGQFAAIERQHPGVDILGGIDFASLTYNDDGFDLAPWLTERGWTVKHAGNVLDLQFRCGETPTVLEEELDRMLHSEYLTASK